MSIQALCPVSVKLSAINILMLKNMISLYSLDINPLLHISFANIFSYSVCRFLVFFSFLFFFSFSSLCMLLNLMEFHLFLLLFPFPEERTKKFLLRHQRVYCLEEDTLLGDLWFHSYM